MQAIPPHSLGSYLRLLRGERRACDVYRTLDVPRPTFCAWEGRRSRPDPVQLGRLLDLYEATPAQRLVAFELRARPLAPSPDVLVTT